MSTTAIAIITWKRQYATRFTSPNAKPFVLRPGDNVITEDDVPQVKRHESSLKRLEEAGHLKIGEPPRKPAPRPAAPAKVVASEPAPIVPPAPPTHTEPPPPPPPPIDPDLDPVDPDAPTVPGMPTMPEWSAGSTYEELKTAAAARAIEFPGNVSKAKLLELLEAWEDERLLADATSEDGEG